MKPMEITRKQFEYVAKAYQLCMTVFMFWLIFFIGTIQGRLTETALCLMGFLILKEFYAHRVHSGSMAGCFVYSVVVFACLSRLSLSLNVSLLCAPLLGLVTAYVASRIAEHLEGHKLLLGKLEQYQKPFNIKTADQAQIIAQCQNKHLSADATNVLLMRYVEKLTPQEIADKLHIEKASADTKLYRARKKLNSP